MTGTVHLDQAGAVATLTFDNPARHNALSVEMWRAVSVLCERLANDQSVRVVVLTGAGAGPFGAGADISEFASHRMADRVSAYDEMTDRAQRMVRTLPMPVVAKIRGFCIGGGLALALSADLRFCDREATFGLPPARLGIGYSPRGVKALADVVGPSRAAEMLYSGAWIDAEEAHRWGLVNTVVESDELDEVTRNWVELASTRAPLSQRASKAAIRAHLATDSERGRLSEHAAELVEQCRSSSDYQEGVAAFIEKRRPNFEGR